jgi:hypothetical protein
LVGPSLAAGLPKVQRIGSNSDMESSMPADEPPPIYSTREADPDIGRSIDDFIAMLAENVDALQDAEADGELALLGDLAKSLAEGARELGYPLLFEAAELLIRACNEQKAEDAQFAVIALTEISQRVRMGHRGAA